MHTELQTLLKKRLGIISDHAFRDRNPAAHLDSLKQVSEGIDGYFSAHKAECDARLKHYLSNHSYQKALNHIST